MICRNCKYFGMDENRIPFGYCSNSKFQLGYNININKLTLDQVNVEDDEGWGFLVGPEFGCIHFAK